MGRMFPAILAAALVLASCAREPLPAESGGLWRIEWEQPDADSLTVGDPFHIKLSGALPAGSRLIGSPLDSLPPIFAVRSASAPRERAIGDSLVYYSQTAELAAFKTGRLQLGPLPVVYRMGPDILAFSTERITIPVASTIADSQQVSDLRDIKPPLDLTRRRLGWFIAAAALLLLLAAAATYWLGRRRSLRGASARPALPPLEEFEQGLRRLAEERLPERGEWGRFTLQLSWLVRRYMERRFGDPILEMTTAEIRHWTRFESIDLKLANRLIQWLGSNDQIKFAGIVPTLAECGRLENEGREIVHVIHAQTAPETVAADPGPDAGPVLARKEG